MAEKVIRSLIIIFILIPALYAQDSNTVYLIFDEPCNDSLPRNFRKMNDTYHRSTDSLPDLSGLASLNASGSAEFCARNLPAIISSIGKNKITIVDLRQESHGFVNGLCISWYGKYDWANVGLSREQIEENEGYRLDSLKAARKITVTRILKKDKATNNIIESEQIPLQVTEVQTEEQLSEKFKVDYLRITATDHRQPEIPDVDRFIKFARNLKDTWLHFHCHAGDGRTTTFLSMYDMLRNAKKVSFHDILLRQYLLGGINLASNEDFPEFDKQYAIGRTKFLQSFYDYCKTNQDSYNTLYSEWLKK
jgi:protein-tyrosine phosphatase